jgi:uncharacterized protein YbbK (DUF523 family)
MPRIAISSCLLGNAVRYDGGHRRASDLVDLAAPWCEWVPFCPEFEAGMGVPREKIRLEGRSSHPHEEPAVIATVSRRDWTADLANSTAVRIHGFLRSGIHGAILKSKSPSCGIADTPVFAEDGYELGRTSGAFSRALLERCPDLPSATERQLAEGPVRLRFFARVFARECAEALAEDRGRADETDRLFRLAGEILGRTGTKRPVSATTPEAARSSAGLVLEACDAACAKPGGLASHSEFVRALFGGAASFLEALLGAAEST